MNLCGPRAQGTSLKRSTPKVEAMPKINMPPVQAARWRPALQPR